MSKMSELHAVVMDFYSAYVYYREDWNAAVRETGQYPHNEWNEEQWGLWHDLTTRYQPER